jgi:hypothetical protein
MKLTARQQKVLLGLLLYLLALFASFAAFARRRFPG